jgi:hypothetical protein
MLVRPFLERELDGAQQPVGLKRKVDRGADVVGLPDPRAGLDDHAVALEARGELGAVDAGEAHPQDVGLAVGDLEPVGAQLRGHPLAQLADLLGAPADLALDGAQRLERALLREVVDAEVGLEAAQQLAALGAPIAKPQRRPRGPTPWRTTGR